MSRAALRTHRMLVAAGVVAALGVACTSGSGGAQSEPGAGAPGVTAAEPGTSAAEPMPSAAPFRVDQGVPQIGPSIVKTARVSVQVPRHTFQRAFDEATTIAARYGGFVESSATQGTKSRSGRVTIRVPAEQFESALAAVQRLGDVQLQEVSGQDVTSRFVDLAARIRNARAQEHVLLGILGTATNVSGTLRVQQSLSDVQLQIEELVGQQRALQNRASLGTIELSLFEGGLPVVRTESAGAVVNPKLSEAWRRAKAVFFGLLYGIVVSAGVLIPLGLLALAVWVVVRRVRRGRPSPRPGPPEAAAGEAR
jgi:Domain of unknown function (DUF4349)